ncbi:RING-type zinc-finger protein [Aureococcus anophagefferens]|nr:RING-type zinc-finger protein [Aureococcus anophagefferens]
MVKTEASQPARRTVPTNQEIIEIDDDVAILGVENECKLPHARGDCPKHKFQVGSLSVCAGHCAQCYCYVCDAPAGDCKSWGAHCVAHAGSSFWQNAREKAKKKKAKQANGKQNGALQSKCGCDQCAVLAEWLGASSRPRVLYVRGRVDKDCVAASAALEPGCVCYKVADDHGRAARDLKIVRAAAPGAALSLRFWTMDVDTYGGYGGMFHNMYGSDSDGPDSDDDEEHVTVDRDNVVTVAHTCATCGEQVAAHRSKDACEVCGMHRGGRGGCDRRLEAVAGAPLLGRLDIAVEIKADDPRQKGDYQENWAANPGWRYDERAAAEGAFARVINEKPSVVCRAIANGLKQVVGDRSSSFYIVDGTVAADDKKRAAELYELADDIFTKPSWQGPGALVAKVGAKIKPRRNASDVVARGVVTIAFYVGPEGFKLPAEWSKSGRGKVRQSRQKRVDILAVARALGAADVAKHATGRFRDDDDEALDWVAPDAADGERLVSSRRSSSAPSSPRARRAGGSVGGFLGDLENRGHAEHEAEPAGLSVRLLPFQRQSVRWMLDQERLPGGANAHVWAPLAPGLLYSPALNTCKRAPAAGDAPGPAGGLLCEEMGMGKTVITAALVLANPAPADRDSQQWADAWASAATGGKTRARGTLVVCPVSLVGQWVQEATEKMEAAAPKVYRYYGGSRITDPEQLKDFDIVVTTYASSRRGVARQLRAGLPGRARVLLRRLVMRHAKAMTYASSARKLLELPPIAENVVDVVFSAEERTAYAALEQQAVAKVRALELEGPAAVRRATFYLHALLRPLRQACSGGAIPTKLPDRGKEAVSAAGDSSGAPIEIDDDDEELGAASTASGPVMRSKLRALISKLVDVRDDDDTAKVLVFSQFNRTLNYLMRELPNYGFDFRCITGSMSMAARSRALADFQQSPPTTIFLLSIRAGACGINLTQANHCVMVEPCTNVALDRQAIGRVHRMGQQRDVTIHRLVLRDSVESRMRDHLYGR